MGHILPSDLAAELLRRGYHVRIRAQGGSMTPALRGGCVVTLAPVVHPAELCVGDVALVLCDGRPMLHRVVCPWPNLRTKGDALAYLDPPPSGVLGKAQGFGEKRGAWAARLSLVAQPAQARLARLCACAQHIAWRRV